MYIRGREGRKECVLVGFCGSVLSKKKMELLGNGFEGLLLHWVLTYGRMTTSLIDLLRIM